MSHRSPRKNVPGSPSDPEPRDDCEGRHDEHVEPDEFTHRLGTSLTIISGYLQLLRRRSRGGMGADPETLRRSLNAMEHAVRKMRDAVDEHLARDGESEGDHGDDGSSGPVPPA